MNEENTFSKFSRQGYKHKNFQPTKKKPETKKQE